MDPITKALHETWKSIVTEGKAESYIDPETGKTKYRIVGNDMLDISDIEKHIRKPTPGARVSQRLLDIINPKPTPGGRIPVYPGEIGPPPIFPKPKPKPTPTPGDGSWGGSKPNPEPAHGVVINQRHQNTVQTEILLDLVTALLQHQLQLEKKMNSYLI